VYVTTSMEVLKQRRETMLLEAEIHHVGRASRGSQGARRKSVVFDRGQGADESRRPSTQVLPSPEER
jgi:hypothetical protein